MPGVWDLLHVGHVLALARARLAGDRLVVGVPSDEVVQQDKGAPPVIPLVDRVAMLRALRCVDEAIPYYRLEFLTHLEMVRPAVLAVGETWGREKRHADAEAWCMVNGCQVVTVPYHPGESSTKIKERVRRGKS
jgi:glycerol-3-phosphate cytidylyltransferase